MGGSFPVCIWDLFVDMCYIGIFPIVWNNAFKERDVLEISVRMGAILLWSSLRMRGEILSGPAAFPGFNLILKKNSPNLIYFDKHNRALPV